MAKEFKGVQLNECEFLGKVVEAPTFRDTDNGTWGFLKLRVVTKEMTMAGQWNDTEQIVPIMASNAGIVKTMQDWVVMGHELYIRGYYKAWGENHGFVVRILQLGHKPIKS